MQIEYIRKTRKPFSQESIIVSNQNDTRIKEVENDFLEYVAVMACTSPEGDFSNRENKCSDISKHYRENDVTRLDCSSSKAELVPNVYSFGVQYNVGVRTPCTICKNVR